MRGRQFRDAGTGPFVRTFARPDRLRVFLDYPGTRRPAILDGAKGWRSGGRERLAPRPSTGSCWPRWRCRRAARTSRGFLDERRAAARLLPPEPDGKLQGIEIPLGGP